MATESSAYAAAGHNLSLNTSPLAMLLFNSQLTDTKDRLTLRSLFIVNFLALSLLEFSLNLFKDASKDLTTACSTVPWDPLRAGTCLRVDGTLPRYVPNLALLYFLWKILTSGLL
jgi:hypothetical protein